MRLAYLGTSEFAATVLRRLADSPYRPALVVTPPDRKQGEGQEALAAAGCFAGARSLASSSIRRQSVNETESLAAIATAGIDVGMVCAFGQLIKPPLLDEIEMLNVHPSLLPRWRGAAPIERAIMAGDKETGVAIMRLTEGLDSGPVALLERVGIAAGEDYGSLSARLAELGGDLAVRALALWDSGDLEFAEQPEEGVTYAEKIEAAERRLDPARSALELERTVRGAQSARGDLPRARGRRAARGREGRAAAAGCDRHRGSSSPTEDALVLGTADGALRIAAVKPAGKREMAAADYLRGNPSPRLAP